MAEALRSMRIYERTADGLILNATDTRTPETTAGIFAVGAEVTNIVTGQKFSNVGTTASPSWQETTGLAVGGTIGSGTAGSILFVGTGGVLAQDNSSLFFDDTNNRLGIGTITPATELQVASTATTTPRGITASQHSTSTDGARFNTFKSRGTNTSPTVIVTGDTIGSMMFLGYDGSNYIETAAIRAISTGTIASTRIGSVLTFSTGTNAAPTVLTERMRIDEAGLVGIGTTAPTHSLTFNSTSTGIALYNTADQTTNYERAQLQWTGNTFLINTSNNGTGTARPIALQAVSGSAQSTLTISRTAQPYFAFTHTSASSSAINFINFGALMNSSSNAQTAFAITPTLTQSGTAGYTALLINPTESSTGSGAKLLIDAQIGGTTQFNVSNTGVVTVAAATATPAGGSTTARLLMGTTAGFGVYYGSGVPTVSAAQGSIYLRSDGSSTSTRMYVNTNGSTTWTNVTTAA